MVRADLSVPQAMGGPGRPGTATPEHLFAAGYFRANRSGWLRHSENSKANRIETMKGPAESGQICSVGRRKIAKKIAKISVAMPTPCDPRSRMLLKVMKGG
jgi:organic hydroperoxide reductase OsmC/OhrA